MTDLSRDLISAYLDGECTPEEADAVRERIAADAEWRAEFEDVRSARDVVRALPSLAVPASCWDGVARAIQDDTQPVVVPLRRHRARNTVFAVGGTAVASAAAVLALVFITDPPASDRPVRPAVAVLGNVHGARATAAGEPMTRVATAAVVAPVSEAGR